MSKKGGNGGFSFRSLDGPLIECRAKFSEPFCNGTIIAPVKHKPHICIRRGLWRVSPVTRPVGYRSAQWQLAHDFANRFNQPLLDVIFGRNVDNEQA